MKTKIINEETKECLIINQVEANKQGLEEMDVDFGIDGKAYLKYYTPKKSLEDFKKEKIQELKELNEKYIFLKYPQYKQNNIAIFGTEKEREDFKIFKEKTINYYDGLLFDLENATTQKEVETIKYNID